MGKKNSIKKDLITKLLKNLSKTDKETLIEKDFFLLEELNNQDNFRLVSVEDKIYVKLKYWENKDPYNVSLIDIKESQIQIPKEVIDKESYLFYYKLLIKIKNDPYNPYTILSGKKVNIQISNKKFQTLLRGIEEDGERIRLQNLYSCHQQAKGKIMFLKGKAFGKKPIKDHNVTLAFLENKKIEIVELLGSFYTLRDIKKILLEELGEDISIESLKSFRNTYLEDIKKRQEEYLKDYGEVRLTHKKSRLVELNLLYQDRKFIYDKAKQREDYRLLLQTLKDIKSEVEGDLVINGTVKGSIDITVENLVNKQINEELLGGLLIKDIIISRVSSRLNINPQFLMNRLQNSIYSKISGFSVNGVEQDAEIIYPSTKVYNFDNILSLAKVKKEEQEKLSSFKEIKEEEKDIIKKNKEGLNEALKEREEKILKSEDIIGLLSKKSKSKNKNG